ncbi:UDP-glycosyltransferase 83A1-like [Apium graveolens]|uniref:UDP-glycosyltransferase 83A1-like n=1 Tax=Apium graveolens TaxID=4045 RepID=UPI003D78CECC
MSFAHILAVPYPAQGHVMPLMELAQEIAKHGLKVTFVNTEFVHNQIVNALSKNDDSGDGISLVTIPDGLEPWEDRKDLAKLTTAMYRVMPGKLHELIENINNAEGDDNITCVIADVSLGWALDIADKLEIMPVFFCPAAAAQLAVFFSLPKLLENGIIENDGNIMKKQMIHLSPTMPPMNTETFTWACFSDFATRKSVFELFVAGNKFMKLAKWILCNSAYELEAETFTSFPEMLPIGPLSASNKLGDKPGSFWPEDSGCLSWLDQQPACSVIYVAHGSFTIFDQTQFQELALGLEMTNKPFLWVVRPDMTDNTKDVYPEGFKERIGSRGKMVNWTPQVKVLRHPAIACFLSHCGWNSTSEGVSNGVPFLCWPYFADQFFNQTYICDVWKVGLRCDKNENGIISKGEIKNKVEELLGDSNFKARAMNLKEKVVNSVSEDGSSNKNLSNFIECLKKLH